MSTINRWSPPRTGSAGRKPKKGESRDMPMTGSAGRDPGKARGAYPKDNFPTPIPGSKPRGSTGSPKETKLVNRQVQGPAVREGGGHGKPAGSRKSPWMASRRSGTANTSKSAKTPK